MEKHRDIARGFVKGDKVKADALWRELVEDLNAHGPPHKDISGWKKVNKLIFSTLIDFSNGWIGRPS